MVQNPEPVEEPTPEDVAVLALARGRSQCEAATEAGVHRNTIGRWMQRPEFTRRIAEERRSVLSLATARLGDKIVKAIDALAAMLESESEQTKLGAAKAMLAALLPLNAQTNLEERIATLEAGK